MSTPRSDRSPFLKPLLVVAVAIAATAASFPMVEAKTFAPRYDVAEHEFKNVMGLFKGRAHFNRDTGTIMVYSHSIGAAQGDTIIRMGGLYPTNSGDLLGSYSAAVSIDVSTIAQVACPVHIGGIKGELSITLQKWRLVSNVWKAEEEATVKTYSCVVFGHINERIQTSRTFTFNAGQSYRVVAEVEASTVAQGVVESLVDACGNVEGCGIDSHKVTLHSIVVPNQAPKARANPSTVWYVNALLGASASGRGCDPDVRLASVKVSVDGHSSTTTSTTQTCLTATHTFTPAAPGSYTVRTVSKDNENAFSAESTNNVNVNLLPTVLASVPGFPDLSQVTRDMLGNYVTVETYVGSDETVRAYRVTAGGIVRLNTMGSYVAQTGDRFAVTENDRLLGTATTTVGGVQKWSGAVVENGEWWQFVPAGTIGVVPVGDSPAPEQSFTPFAEIADSTPAVEETHSIDNQ